MKKIFYNLSVLLFAVFMSVLSILISGCFFNYNYEKVEGEIWTYYILNRREIALVGINFNAIPDDGVLYIPKKIDGYNVAKFKVQLGKKPDILKLPPTDQFKLIFVKKIIVADGIPLDARNIGDVSVTRIVEFEGKTPIGEKFLMNVNYIVPDGCVDNFKPVEPESFGYYSIMEKSQSQKTDWLIDGNGLLIGYFGLETEQYVLPEGIKKIDGNSFLREIENPKTIILNEGLEFIGRDSLHFWNSEVDIQAFEEIRIPKSVKTIEKNAFSAKIIYLYRSTETDRGGFTYFDSGTGKREYSKIIYLD